MNNIRILKDRYRIDFGKQIGHGSYGTVFLCIDVNDNNKELCAKVVKSKNNLFFQREMELMKKIKQVANEHPNIVKVLDVFIDNKNNKERLIIIEEKCDGNLEQYIKQNSLSPWEALEIVKQIVNGYKLLFTEKIIHRDLKPSNILYLNNAFKIADFGFARIVDPKNGCSTKLGTVVYQAPQIFFDKTYSNSADIFSLGVIFYYLIFKKYPFKADIIREELKSLQTKPFQIISKLFKENDPIPRLIERMLVYREENRISWEDLFNHDLIILNQSQASASTPNQNQYLKQGYRRIQNRTIHKDSEFTQNQLINQDFASNQNNFYCQDEYLSQRSTQSQDQGPNMGHSLSQDQKHQIANFLAYIESELKNKMQYYEQKESSDNYFNSILIIRKVLCNLAQFLLESTTQGLSLLAQRELDQVIKNQRKLQEAFQKAKIQEFPFVNLQQQIEILQEQIKSSPFKYEKGKKYYFSYLKIVYAFSILAQIDQYDQIALYEIVSQIVKNSQIENNVLTYLNRIQH